MNSAYSVEVDIYTLVAFYQGANLMTKHGGCGEICVFLATKKHSNVDPISLEKATSQLVLNINAAV